MESRSASLRASDRLPLLLAAALAGACGSSSPRGPVHEGAPSGWLVYQSNRGNAFGLRVVRLDGTDDQALAGRAALNAFAPSFSIAAGSVAFTSVQGGTASLVVHAWNGDAERVLDVGTLRPAAPNFSPDGTVIAFEGSEDTGAGDIYLVPAAGGTPVALAADPANDAGPAWSPDGRLVFFGSARSGQWEVWSVGADGAGLAQVTTGSQLQGRVAVSPDGLSIAFTQNDVASIGHVVIHTLADGAERILFAGAGESDPAFDASGTRIAVVTRAYGAPEIVIRDVATGALVQRLTHLDGLGATPAFAR